MIVRAVPGYVVALLVLAACGGGDRSGNEAAAGIVLTLGPATTVIGVLDGDATREFGLVQDAATDDQGRVYTLDSRYQRVRVHDRDGRLLAEAGRGGRGPGEFFIPRSLVLDTNGDVHVLDQGNVRIHRYRLAGDELELLGTTPFQSLAVDLCAIGEQYAIYGHDTEGIVRILDRSGSVVRYISPPAHDSSTSRLRRAATGPMACIPEHGMIVVAAQQNGTVRAFGEAGEAIWSVTLPDFTGLSSSDGPDGSVTYSVSDAGFYHQVESLFVVSGNVLAVQWLELGEGTMPGEVPILRTLTHLLDARDGSRIGLQTDLPLVKRSYGASMISISSDPFPQVAVHQAMPATDDR